MIDDINNILNEIEGSDSEFIRDIKKYWNIISGINGTEHIILEPLKKLKEQMPNVPEEEWKDMIKEYNIPAMEGDYINQFMNNFTHEELKELLHLYDTNPLLKKAKERNKIILQETEKLNEKWINKFTYLINDRVYKWKSIGYID